MTVKKMEYDGPWIGPRRFQGYKYILGWVDEHWIGVYNGTASCIGMRAPSAFCCIFASVEFWMVPLDGIHTENTKYISASSFQCYVFQLQRLPVWNPCHHLTPSGRDCPATVMDYCDTSGLSLLPWETCVGEPSTQYMVC